MIAWTVPGRPGAILGHIALVATGPPALLARRVVFLDARSRPVALVLSVAHAAAPARLAVRSGWSVRRAAYAVLAPALSALAWIGAIGVDCTFDRINVQRDSARIPTVSGNANPVGNAVRNVELNPLIRTTTFVLIGAGEFAAAAASPGAQNRIEVAATGVDLGNACDRGDISPPDVIGGIRPARG